MAYIEREKVLEIAKDKYYSDFHKSMADLTSLRELLEDTPTADVVEVVRCRDCIYYQKMATGGLCMCGDKKTSYAADFYPKENDFCSYGERKDENDK